MRLCPQCRFRRRSQGTPPLPHACPGSGSMKDIPHLEAHQTSGLLHRCSYGMKRSQPFPLCQNVTLLHRLPCALPHTCRNIAETSTVSVKNPKTKTCRLHPWPSGSLPKGPGRLYACQERHASSPHRLCSYCPPAEGSSRSCNASRTGNVQKISRAPHHIHLRRHPQEAFPPIQAHTTCCPT